MLSWAKPEVVALLVHEAGLQCVTDWTSGRAQRTQQAVLLFCLVAAVIGRRHVCYWLVLRPLAVFREVIFISQMNF